MPSGADPGRESLLAAHLARVDQELAAVEREKQAARDERAAWTPSGSR
jgi:hypothetical protein